MDALEMLREDHRKVQEMFEQFERSEDPQAKQQICAEALTALKVHAALEEELFYPAVREVSDDEEKVDEALEEHHVAKLLASELEEMDAGDDHFDAKFKVLAESVKHHIEEEESEIIPAVESQLDTEDLGERMAELKQDLEQKMSDGSGRGRASPSSRTRAKRRASGTRRHTSGSRGSRSKRRRA